MRSLVAVALFAALFAGPAAAEDPGQEGTPETGPFLNDPAIVERFAEAKEKALQGLEALMREAEGLVEQLPRYGLPYIDDDGNIIIERQDTPSPDDRPAPKRQDRAEDMMDL